MTLPDRDLKKNSIKSDNKLAPLRGHYHGIIQFESKRDAFDPDRLFSRYSQFGLRLLSLRDPNQDESLGNSLFLLRGTVFKWSSVCFLTLFFFFFFSIPTIKYIVLARNLRYSVKVNLKKIGNAWCSVGGLKRWLYEISRWSRNDRNHENGRGGVCRWRAYLHGAALVVNFVDPVDWLLGAT